MLCLSRDVPTGSYRSVATFRGRAERRNWQPRSLLEGPNRLFINDTHPGDTARFLLYIYGEPSGSAEVRPIKEALQYCGCRNRTLLALEGLWTQQGKLRADGSLKGPEPSYPDIPSSS